MKRHMVSVMLLLAAVVLALTPRVAAAAEERPFAATFSPQSVTPDGKYYVYDVAGTASHAGNFSAVANNHFSRGGTRLVGFMVITAQNGDELWIEYEQTLEITTAAGTWTGTYTITGGTGRFAEASGQGDAIVVIPTEPPGPVIGTFEGTINF